MESEHLTFERKVRMQIIEVAGKRYELASPMERWLGQVLDGFIYLAIIIVPLLLRNLIGQAGVVIGIIGFVISILYLLFQDGLKNGQSYGKRIGATR